jgi:GNAT superfamily N-acetyltransferase
MARTSLEIRALGSSAADRELLRALYTDLFIPAFVDADERESLANIQRYLELKAAGWYGANNYHIRVLLDGGRPIGGAIADYLAVPNTGVIEFLVIAPGRRERGLGQRLLGDVEAALAEDARVAGAPGLRAIAAEMNDPFHSPLRDSMDPFRRVLVWSGWGYSKLDFPYVQPALSAAQRPVASMLLAWKPVHDTGDAVASDTVKDVVHEYMRWAMRIEEPKRSPEFTRMARYLDGRASVRLQRLDHYAGHDATRPLAVREVTAADADLPALRALYEANFPDRATAIESGALGSPPPGGWRGADHAYHLWALRSVPEAPVAGLASFFTLREAGFGGYLALAPPLRGTGRLPLLLARIETQMVRDALGARGWYAECADEVLDTFRRAGFHEVPISYRQPSLRPGGPNPILHLLYKAFGRVYEPPSLDGAALLAAVRRIQHVVYGIERPEASEAYRDLARQIDEQAGVPLR